MKFPWLFTYLTVLSLFSTVRSLPNLGFLKQLVVTQQNFFSLARDFSYPSPPNGFDFWRSAKELGQKATNYAEKELNEAKSRYEDASAKIEDFHNSINILGDKIREFGVQSQESFQMLGFNFEEFSAKLSEEVEVILQELKEEFKEPLPEDQTERYQQRERAVDRALDKLEGALVKVYKMFGVQELEVREKFSHVRPSIKSVIMICGNLADNHPELVEVLLVTGVIMLVPEAWIIRPILSVFGFGPAGPLKGSAAAWAQRYFFRTAIEEGSWFARLQAAGMTGNYGWKYGLGIAVGVIGSIGAGCR